MSKLSRPFCCGAARFAKTLLLALETVSILGTILPSASFDNGYVTSLVLMLMVKDVVGDGAAPCSGKAGRIENSMGLALGSERLARVLRLLQGTMAAMAAVGWEDVDEALPLSLSASALYSSTAPNDKALKVVL